MSNNAIQKAPSWGQLTSMDQAMKFADMLSKSTLVPKEYKGSPGNVLVAMQMGAQIGLEPLAALTNIAVINGRPTVYGDAAVALVRNHPEFEDMDEEFDTDTMTATCRIKRRGQKWQTRTFSQDDAKKAGLWGKSGPWTQYPKRMLQIRARAWAMRDVFPDALNGMQVKEEVEDYVQTDVRVVETKRGLDGFAARIADDEPELEGPAEGFEGTTETSEDLMGRMKEELAKGAPDRRTKPVQEKKTKPAMATKTKGQGSLLDDDREPHDMAMDALRSAAVRLKMGKADVCEAAFAILGKPVDDPHTLTMEELERVTEGLTKQAERENA